MQYQGVRVLILEGYTRQSIALIRAFHLLGCYTTALCSTKLDVAYASRYTDVRLLDYCNRDDEEGTTVSIRRILSSNQYDVVIPTSDFSARLLSKNKGEFSQYTRVASNDWDVYQLAGDKLNTMTVCMKENIPCPNTLINITNIDQIVSSNIRYPIVVKPRVGYGAIGYKKVDTAERMKALFSDQHDPSAYVFQEYIPQTDLQYECAMFVDNHNEVKTALVFSKNRWFPINGGSSTLNITVERPDIAEICTKLLQKIQWRGAADIDLIQDPRDNIAKIMEINPRVSGSVKICFLAGVDQARQMLELAYEQPVTAYDNYTIGQRLRCAQTDLLWFIKSPNRFRSTPSWFSNRKTRDQIFSWRDPLPWFAFSISGLFRFRSEMKKRGKSNDIG